ncbi:MAG: hypothetical protein WA919_03950 [Coleofasciculaceae cyanobacterium]
MHTFFEDCPKPVQKPSHQKLVLVHLLEHKHQVTRQRKLTRKHLAFILNLDINFALLS